MQRNITKRLQKMKICDWRSWNVDKRTLCFIGGNLFYSKIIQFSGQIHLRFSNSLHDNKRFSLCFMEDANYISFIIIFLYRSVSHVQVHVLLRG